MTGPHTAAIILARGGSKGLPGKNLTKLGGVSLVGRSVLAASKAAGVDTVWVSTDDAAIAAEAQAFGAEVIERPASLSGDTASSESGWLHAVSMIELQYPGLSRLVFLQCTSPFTRGTDIDACLTAMAEKNADCGLSVAQDHYFYWQRDEDGLGFGTNHAHLEQRKRRQDLPDSFRETGAIYCANAAPFKAHGQRFCGTVALCLIDRPALEIDSHSDLAEAEALIQREVDAPDLSGVKALVMDFDGVHTDDKVHVDQNGVESVTTSRSDGLGLGRLREAGTCKLLILSKERNPVVAARGAKLGIEVLQGIDDKARALSDWLAGQGVSPAQALFVGNDVNDLPAIEVAGLGACPSDAHPQVMASVDWIVNRPGGNGALRQICDALLALDQSR